MKKLTYILIAIAALSVVGCKKKKLEKSLDGTYERSVETNYVYSDSTTEVFAQALLIDYSRDHKGWDDSFGWNLIGNSGSLTVETKKSERYDDELELIFINPDWKKMLPMKSPTEYVTPNTAYLNQCKFYLSDAGNDQVYFTIVDGSGMEKNFLYTKQ